MEARDVQRELARETRLQTQLVGVDRLAAKREVGALRPVAARQEQVVEDAQRPQHVGVGDCRGVAGADVVEEAAAAGIVVDVRIERLVS